MLYCYDCDCIVDSCYLSTNTKACSSAYKKRNNGDAVVVCGSPGEVANNPLERNTFTFVKCKNIGNE